MLCNIEGQITGLKFFQPEGDSKKKPHQILSVMQSNGEDSEIIKVKDYNLSARYEQWGVFSNICQVREWAFNGRSGLSVTVQGNMPDMMMPPVSDALPLTDRVDDGDRIE